MSHRSAELFGQTSPYYVPQGLYYEIVSHGVSPSVHQFTALSVISNYRLVDWLEVFGFRLGEISKLRSLTSRRCTVFLDSSVYDDEQWIPWFVGGHSDFPHDAIVPLGQILNMGQPRRLKELLLPGRSKFLYAKVGRDDGFAFPDLVSGSIVRANTFRKEAAIQALGGGISERLFLVEHGSHIHCGHLSRADDGRILLCSGDFPFVQTELAIGPKVRILGVLDAELRSLTELQAKRTLRFCTAELTSVQPSHSRVRGDLQQLIRMCRTRAGVSFREASSMSLKIAQSFGDSRYFAAPGTLSDYENHSSPLHHVQKVMSLCVLYSVDFWTVLRTGGLPIESLGNEAMADDLLDRKGSRRAQPDDQAESDPFPPNSKMYSIRAKWEEIPFFLTGALPALCGLKDISLSDMFCVGAQRRPIHPSLTGAILVAVNRRLKAPRQSAPSHAREQQVYMILLRDGGYLCATCETHDGMLVIFPHSERPHSSLQLKNGIDAEVVGRVTAILRRLP